jgi:hypothetical protein
MAGMQAMQKDFQTLGEAGRMCCLSCAERMPEHQP